MKIYLLVPVILFNLNFSFSQNNWIFSMYGYDAAVESNSFELDGNNSFVYTWANPSTGLDCTIKKLNSLGEVVSELYYPGAGQLNRFDGINNRLYSYKGYDRLVKMDSNFDTLNQINITDGGWMNLFSPNEIFITRGNNLLMIDSNLNLQWQKPMLESLPSYQSSSITYNPIGGAVRTRKNNNGEIICLSLFEHYDSNFNTNMDSTNIVIYKINSLNGNINDSLVIGYNSYKWPLGNVESLCENSSGHVIFTLGQYDINFTQVGNELCIYNPITNNITYQSIPLGLGVFQGFNNEIFLSGIDSIFVLDNNFNIINSIRLIENNYNIIKIDAVSDGFIVKIKDLTENLIKFIHVDNNFQFDLCNNNNLFQENYSVCQVTVENNNCRVIWEESGSNNIVGYGVYRENTLGSYDSLSYVPVDSLSEYLDLMSTPNQFSQKYKITYFDTCFRESPLSNFHKTIHLTANVGVNDEVNLIWTPYVGTNYNTYYIYRGTSPNNLTVLDSVSNSIMSYTDFSAPVGINLYYEIIIQPLNTCSSTKALYTSIKSNTKSTMETNSIESLSVSDYDIYPNPTDAELHIVKNNLNNEPYTIFDIMGIKVAEGNLAESHTIISLNELSSGSYLLFIGNNNSPRRIVKQ